MARTPKIRFIEPQSRRDRPLNTFIRWPLIGPILLATLLRDRGIDAMVYNENFSGRIDENPAAWQDVCSADVVAITIMTPTASRGYAVADRVRQEAPKVCIAIGGVHATFCPDEAQAHADIVCCGEGENIIEKIARGEIRSGIVRPEPPADLDALPAPDFNLMFGWDALVASAYRRDFYEIPIMTSRGCPYGCTYCSVTRMFGRKVRRRSVEKVAEDMQRYHDDGFRMIFFYDDNFLSDRPWAMKMLPRMKQIGMRFQAQARVDFSWRNTDPASPGYAAASRKERDHALLAALEKANCMGLIMGYETIDDDTAAEWHKGYVRSDGSLDTRFLEDTRILHAYGIWSYGMFVLGPRHTRRTVDRILRFARRSSLHSLQISILTPFPGTPLFEEMKPHLFLTQYPGDWDFYDGAHCVWNNGKLTPEEVQHVIVDAHKRFYYPFGGWTGRSLRTVANRPIAFKDKLMDYVTRVRNTRDVFDRWEAETNDFLAMIRARTGG